MGGPDTGPGLGAIDMMGPDLGANWRAVKIEERRYFACTGRGAFVFLYDPAVFFARDEGSRG